MCVYGYVCVCVVHDNHGGVGIAADLAAAKISMTRLKGSTKS